MKPQLIPWPAQLRQAVDTIAILFAQAYTLARSKSVNHSFAMVRLMAKRDQAVLEATLLRRELEILRRNRASLLPHALASHPSFVPHSFPQSSRKQMGNRLRPSLP